MNFNDNEDNLYSFNTYDKMNTNLIHERSDNKMIIPNDKQNFILKSNDNTLRECELLIKEIEKGISNREKICRKAKDLNLKEGINNRSKAEINLNKIHSLFDDINLDFASLKLLNDKSENLHLELLEEIGNINKELI